eukprot:jgi/Botrbrau1/8933/Bobra.0148s0046.1
MQSFHTYLPSAAGSSKILWQLPLRKSCRTCSPISQQSLRVRASETGGNLEFVRTEGRDDGSTLFVFGTKEEAEAEQGRLSPREQNNMDTVEGHTLKFNGLEGKDPALGHRLPEHTQAPVQGSSSSSTHILQSPEASKPQEHHSVRTATVTEEGQPGEEPSHREPGHLLEAVQEKAQQPDSAPMMNTDNANGSPSPVARSRRKNARTLKAAPTGSASNGSAPAEGEVAGKKRGRKKTRDREESAILAAEEGQVEPTHSQEIGAPVGQAKGKGKKGRPPKSLGSDAPYLINESKVLSLGPRWRFANPVKYGIIADRLENRNVADLTKICREYQLPGYTKIKRKAEMVDFLASFDLPWENILPDLPPHYFLEE